MLLRQDIMLFKKPVDNQFTDIRNFIKDDFVKVMEVIKAKIHFDVVIIDSKGVDSENSPDMLDGYNGRRGTEHAAPQSYNETGDTKKEKYDLNENFRYTTLDCIFKTRIKEIYDKYAQKDRDISIEREDDVICDYIKGSIQANR
ncbi:hypothetical protein HAX54_033217 [Datura stramonium]|uniref:Uncharacterized protein n=1 Tax=Datura stramonium TaxID=4076 RepID=A0ABS8VF48_DATST|nr:hypothetical protein [Datura stramonium]